MARLVITTSVTVILQLDERITAAPWEALSALKWGLMASAGAGSFHPALWQFRLSYRRTLDGPTVRLTDPIPGPHCFVSCLGRLSDAAILRRREIPGRRGSAPVAVEIALASEPVRDKDTVTLCHLVAAPVETSGGLRLTFAQRTSPVLTPPDLVAPADFVAGLGRLRVVVLQGFPVATDGPRTDADRDSAAMMRRVGADLMRARVPAVIVLPPLRAGLAAEALDTIFTAVALGPRDAGRRLGEAVSGVQRMIAAEPGANPDDALEAAFEVCFYMIDALNLSVA
jgi:hypothetical protein